jgi:hypothetical protein
MNTANAVALAANGRLNRLLEEGVDGLKTIIRSLLISLALHALFLAGALAAGRVKFGDDKPDVLDSYEQADVLRHETAVGAAVSPALLLATFLGTAAVCAIIIAIGKRIRKR